MSSDWVFPKSPTQPTNMPDGPGHSSLGCEWTSHSRHSLHCRSLWWLLRGNLHCPGSVCTGPRVGANCTVAVSRSVVLAFKSSSPWFWYEHNSSLQRFVIVFFFCYCFTVYAPFLLLLSKVVTWFSALSQLTGSMQQAAILQREVGEQSPIYLDIHFGSVTESMIPPGLIVLIIAHGRGSTFQQCL